MKPRVLISLLALAVVMTACDGGDEPRSEPSPTLVESPSPTPSPTPSPSPAPEPVTGSDCDNEAAAIATGEAISDASSATGEEVTAEIVVDPEAPFGCQAFLVATVDGVTSSNVIAGDLQLDLIPPRIRVLADIDDAGSPEAFVSVQAGASTEFGLLFLLDPVRPVTFGDPSRGNGDLIAFGGGVTHLDGAACVPEEPGTVVISAASLPGKKYLLVRTFYRVEDDLLVKIRSDRSTETFNALGAYPEFSSEPFSNCPA